jgi:hypothetical protein
MTTLKQSSVQTGGFHTLAEIERAHIEQVVANCGTLGEAADTLGIDVATLYRKRRDWAKADAFYGDVSRQLEESLGALSKPLNPDGPAALAGLQP